MRPFGCSFKTLTLSTMVICGVVYLLMMRYVTTSTSHVSSPSIVADVPWLNTVPERAYSFAISVDKPLHLVDERFLSFTVDSSQIRKGLIHPFLWDKKLVRTMKHLGGGYIRFGGTAADLLVFSPGFRLTSDQDILLDGSACAYEFGCPISTSLQNVKKFSMSAENWKAINEFALATDMKLMFDLNVLLRNQYGSWNSSNAELILDIAFAYQYKIDWQLGNEPNAFKRVFGVEIPPKNLSNDFNTLRALLNKYSLYNSSKLVGPDVTNPRNLPNALAAETEEPEKYLSEFLSAGPEIDAVTWHHYYTGPNVSVEDYLNVETYNSFISSCRRMADVVKIRPPRKQIWISETGSSYGGGAHGLSDRFVSSLLWTDKLGVAAREGISVVMRQSVYAGVYALLGDGLRPNPDYWVSILHKLLIGRKVLNITCTDDVYDHTLRAYAHCSKDSRLTVFGVNIANVFLGIDLHMNATAKLYSLSSSSIDSKMVYLNGNLLMLDYTSQELPDFHPAIVDVSDPVPIPPHSIFFLHVNLIAPACLSSNGSGR